MTVILMTGRRRLFVRRSATLRRPGGFAKERRSRDVWGRFAPYAQAAALDFALTM